MKKLIISFMVLMFLSEYIPIRAFTEEAFAERPEPAYAKWGRLAMETAKEKYPKAKILDYLHIGREKGQTTDIEKFKLWIEDSGKEFGLYIDIEFDSKTERVIRINTRRSAN
ncbi:YqzG/YhdC family protein [Cytobacillus firmus]|uniref:YqzG/YhdC family protein n=1 Tax=Cytobacillus firmus TaxID=1399 RepID=UPI002228135C|nr:YqzG/YhdC family protein [Cytobacillus firmus]